MGNFLLDIVPHSDGNYYFSNFGESFIYALIGFVVVFVGIVIIILVIYSIGFLIKKTNNFEFLRKKSLRKRPDIAPTQEVEASVEEDVPDEVKVAIVAALMAYYEEEKSVCEFKIKKIKKL